VTRDMARIIESHLMEAWRLVPLVVEPAANTITGDK